MALPGQCGIAAAPKWEMDDAQQSKKKLICTPRTLTDGELGGDTDGDLEGGAVTA